MKIKQKKRCSHCGKYNEYILTHVQFNAEMAMQMAAAMRMFADRIEFEFTD